jgi:hypothetical protein
MFNGDLGCVLSTTPACTHLLAPGTAVYIPSPFQLDEISSVAEYWLLGHKL